MEHLVSKVKEELVVIPVHIKESFPSFKQSLLQKAKDDEELDESTVNKVLAILEADFLRPLGKTIDKALANTEQTVELFVLKEESKMMKRTIKALEKNTEVTPPVPYLEEEIEGLNAFDSMTDLPEIPTKPASTPKKKRKTVKKKKKKKTTASAEADIGGGVLKDGPLLPAGQGDFEIGQIVSTPIMFGKKKSKKQVWVDAIIEDDHDGQKFDLRVLDPARYIVNAMAEQVDRSNIRMKGRVTTIQQSGCYLKFKKETDELFQIWSHTHVEGCLMYFRPNKKVAKFKYKGKPGIYKKGFGSLDNQYYETYINFAKEAAQYEADMLIFDYENWNASGLTPAKYVLFTDRRMSSMITGCYYAMKGVECVACVHNANNDFDGKLAISQLNFLTEGHRLGAVSKL